ncbi:MAG: hypothetical protein VKM34_11650, partial [Cyanobacteriota bacterium]|nr:hypothetical protein [Cyanobacteriota bacterium]
GFPLHLVERDRRVASHQCLGIAPGGSEHVEVIQGAVAPFARNQLLGQGAFPVCRAPVTTTAGITFKRSARAAPTRRGRGFMQ